MEKIKPKKLKGKQLIVAEVIAAFVARQSEDERLKQAYGALAAELDEPVGYGQEMLVGTYGEMAVLAESTGGQHCWTFRIVPALELGQGGDE